MGGLTLAAALHQRGFAVRVYEQAPKFVRLGAGIQMSPNAMRVLRGIGLEAAHPRARVPAALLDQPRMGHRRDEIRTAARRRRRGEIRRALSADASRRPARGAGLARARGADLARQEAHRRRLARRRRHAALCRRHDGAGRRRDRRRRHPFAGARTLARRRAGELHRPRRLSHHVSRRRCSTATRSTNAASGGGRTATS